MFISNQENYLLFLRPIYDFCNKTTKDGQPLCDSDTHVHVQITMLRIMQSSPVPWYMYPPQHLTVGHSQPIFFPQYDRPSFTLK